jgi:hypothetical protein
MAIENGLADIIPPAAPPVNELIWLWWLVPILLLAIVFLYYLTRPRTLMRRKLRRLRHLLKDDAVAGKSLCFQIASSLRQAYATSRLDSIRFDASRQAKWHDFVTRLQQLQYQAAVPRRDELDSLLQEAIDWL